ncbi:retroviral-like aspartic protease family protein [Blastomonas sp.]|uniref:retroviral-like aspartic protease family protein n=1 Tax=Blastomonas sp. TaxID=1909299 RepID=UPI00391B997B
MRGWTVTAGLFGLAVASLVNAQTPLSFSASGHVVAPVRIDGEDQYLFVVDTGAEGSAVYERFAREADLAPAGEEQIVGQTGSASLPLRRITRLEVDRRTFGPIVASELPDRRDGAVMAGIIGLDVMGGHTVDFDLPSARLSLLDGAEAKALIKTLGPAQSARAIIGGLLAVPVEVNGVTGWGVIDTGARETRINTRFATMAKVEEDKGGVAATVHGATNAASSLRPGRARSVRMLGKDLGETSIRIADLPVFESFGLQDEPAMIIGADYLGRFRLVIDFPTRRAWLQ